MKRRILFVDDEPNVLQAIRRAIRKDFDVTIAEGPESGLNIIAGEPEFDVIVSDMRMPIMSGIGFLRAARQLSPDSVRIMLTGNSDQQTAIDAVNDGQVFRFLTKPCDTDVMRQVLQQALRQYDLQTAERALLEETLQGSLAVMTELLGLARPDALGRTRRISTLVSSLMSARGGVSDEERRDITTAAMLSQLGSVALPVDLVSRIDNGRPLDGTELDDWHGASVSVARALEQVPRMESIARILRYQHKHFDGGGAPNDGLSAESIPLGARALHLAFWYDSYRSRGYDRHEILEALSSRRREFDPRLLEALQARHAASEQRSVEHVMPSALAVGMTIAADLCTDRGSLLVCEGQKVSEAVMDHLQRFIRDGELTEPCAVYADGLPKAVNG